MANPTVLEAQKWASSCFKTNVDRQLPETIMLDLFTWNRTQLLMHLREMLTDAQWAEYQRAVKAIADGQPEQYVTGTAMFYGRAYSVTPAVLIPRPETEELVEWFFTDLQDKPTCSVLDVGTGSGVLAITLALEKPAWQVSATDISHDALDVAKQNAKDLGASVTWYEGDLFSDVSGQRFDVIISNPPYISETERPLMDQSVLDFEPDLALFAEHEGLAIYERLAAQLMDHLTPDGVAYFEIGFAQGTAVKNLMQTAIPTATVTVRQDITGHDRMVRVKLSSGDAN